MASASSTKMWRGTALIAASTISSRIPSTRSRSTIRARVRSDVIPMPVCVGPRVPIARVPIAANAGGSTLEPHADIRHLIAIGEIDLQRGHRHEALLDRMKIGAVTGIGSGTCGTDPIHGLPARALGADHVFGAMPAPEPRDLDSIDIVTGHIGDVDVEQPRTGGPARMALDQINGDLCRRFEMARRLRGERNGD